MKLKGNFFRELVLSVYRSLISQELTLSPIAQYLALQYYKKYKKLSKSGKYYKVVKTKELKYTEHDLKIDFEIVAVASLRGVDIVVSADKRTMLSKLAAETYDVVNVLNGLRTPQLVDYFVFRRSYVK